MFKIKKRKEGQDWFNYFANNYLMNILIVVCVITTIILVIIELTS